MEDGSASIDAKMLEGRRPEELDKFIYRYCMKPELVKGTRNLPQLIHKNQVIMFTMTMMLHWRRSPAAPASAPRPPRRTFPPPRYHDTDPRREPP